MKKAVPGIITIHCIVHRQHLVAKHLSENLNTSLNIVIKINKIKSRSLNDRMFRELCHENGEEFERLLHYTKVRSLSKGNCLKRVSELFDTIVEFLEEQDGDLSTKLKAIEQQGRACHTFNAGFPLGPPCGTAGPHCDYWALQAC